MLKIAICDDEKSYTDKMQFQISNLIQNCEIVVFHTGKDFVQSVKDYDIVFMDIELPDYNGLKLLQKYPINSIIIILTLHKEEVFNGYYIHAFRFLLKPIDDLLFREALISAVNELKSQAFIGVTDENGNFLKLPIKKIVYAEAGDKRTGIRTLSSFYYAHCPINKICDYLDMNFYFVHRSYIVNMNYIEKIDIKNKTILTYEGSQIIVSRLKWKDFKDTFYDFIKANMGDNSYDL